MPKWIKKKNTSIKDDTGLCSICYLAKENDEQVAEEEYRNSYEKDPMDEAKEASIERFMEGGR